METAVIVKICGNKRREDLLACDRFGVDILGVVVEVAASKRSVDRSIAQGLFLVPTRADKAMLLCDHQLDNALDLISFVKPYVVHLTGSEPPEYVRSIKKRFRVKVFKSIHLPKAGGQSPGSDGLVGKIAEYAEAGVHNIVLDTSDPSRNLFGGTGECSDWDVAREVVSQSRLPVLLAGGISADNVCDAIAKVRPHGIDLASGVEASIGVKDPIKVRRLFENIKSLKLK